MLKEFPVKENSIVCWVNPHDFGTHRLSLVFVHGSGSNSTVWTHQYASLHRQFNIVAVNLAGHGPSGGHGEREIARYAGQVKDILDAVGLARPVLIGHSMGAAVALSLAATWPRIPAGIVLAGGSATLPVNPEILQGLQTNPDLALDLIAKFSLARENRPRLYDPLRASLAETNITVLAGDMQACSSVDLTRDLHKITVPALVVCGVADKMTPPAASEKIASGIVGAKLILIEGAGHMVMMEKPDEFNEALENFCASLL